MNFYVREQTEIAKDIRTRGAVLIPIILGADKTTVSVGTGSSEFHPLYMSIGNVHNDMRRAHRDAVMPIAFLSIPKCMSALYESSNSSDKLH